MNSQNKYPLCESVVHTCHDECQKPMCVLRRENDRNKDLLKLQLVRHQELLQQNAELKDTLRHFEHECETIQEMKTEMYKLQQQIADYEKALEKK